MHVEIEATATLSKGVTIKREKDEKDIEIVVAHLSFSNAIVSRETIDAFLNRFPGWAQAHLFDELGAPIAHIELGLPRMELTATGVIRGIDGEEQIKLAQADLSKIVLTLVDKGALLSGALAWKIAGDEASDLEPLLGRICVLHVVIQDSGQQDMLKDHAADKKANPTPVAQP